MEDAITHIRPAAHSRRRRQLQVGPDDVLDALLAPLGQDEVQEVDLVHHVDHGEAEEDGEDEREGDADRLADVLPTPTIIGQSFVFE